MNSPRNFFLATMLLFWGLSPSVHAQLYRSSSSGYSPYGGSSRTSSGGAYSGAGISYGPQITFGPFGPQLNYFTPLGYVMQPGFPGMPTYFGPSVGINVNGSRTVGYGYLQGSVGSLNSTTRYQNSSGSMSDGAQKQYDGGPRRASSKNVEHRRRLDQFLDGMQPNNDEAKRKQNQEVLSHSLANPTKQEIVSGAAMNTILEALSAMRPQFKEAPEMSIDPALVKQLNFTKGSGTGSFGMLRDEGKILWPTSLSEMAPKEQTSELCAAISKGFLEAYQQVSMGRADMDTLKQLQRASEQLSNLVSANVRTMDLRDYMEAKQFIKSLDETVTFLKQPDAADWLPGKSKIKPRNMQELVHIMSEKGIRFAPALLGNDKAYNAMQQMMVKMYYAVAADTMPGKQ